jgi:hypothetical protein
MYVSKLPSSSSGSVGAGSSATAGASASASTVGGSSCGTSAASGAAGAPKVTKPAPSESVAAPSLLTAGPGAGVGGPTVGSGGSGAESDGGGVSGPGGAGASGVTALPQAKDWNWSDTAASEVVPLNGAGVSGAGVSNWAEPSRRRASRRQRGPSSPMMISSNSSQASLAFCVRFVGSLTSMRSIQSEMSWSIEGSMDLTAGICSLTWRRRIAIGASVSWNGTRPVYISNAMQPTE